MKGVGGGREGVGRELRKEGKRIGRAGRGGTRKEG